MKYNLIISYDLYKPGQNYDETIKAIKSLGTWAKVHQSVWYVKSDYTSSQARDKIWKTMDSNDTLFVVDASSNAVAWQNLSDEVSSFLSKNWMASVRSSIFGS